MKTLPFEVNDRRGQKKEPRVDHSVKAAKDVPSGNSSEWKSLCFIIALGNSQQGPIPMGKAIGLRGDEASLFVDYIFSPQWPEGFDWTDVAKKRLNSFLGCECSDTTVCATHREYMRQWHDADTNRLGLAGAAAIPEALEAFVTKMRATQSRIVAPGLS